MESMMLRSMRSPTAYPAFASKYAKRRDILGDTSLNTGKFALRWALIILNNVKHRSITDQYP